MFFFVFSIIPREEDCPTDSCSHERAHYLIFTRVEKGKRPFSKHKKKRENGEEVGRKQGRMGRKKKLKSKRPRVTPCVCVCMCVTFRLLAPLVGGDLEISLNGNARQISPPPSTDTDRLLLLPHFGGW